MRRNSARHGVTLLEMLIVVTLIGVLAGLTYPTVASGIDSLRLRSAGDRVVSFLTTALDRAERRQQVVEIRISPAENALSARSSDLSFDRTLAVPDSIRIVSVLPPLVDAIDPNQQRRFLVYPGGTAPRIGIELASPDGRKRMVTVDPLTGLPRSELETQ
jgi:prepilin-type N-terminal cleavage/methylation domain-containing protein